MFKSFIPNFIFWPFTWSKLIVIAFTIIAIFLSIITIIEVPTLDMIMDMNDLGFNVVFSISALGISILGLDFKKYHKENSSKEYFSKYIGFVLALISILIFTKVAVISMNSLEILTPNQLRILFLLESFIIILSVLTTMSNFMKIHMSK